jgi:hypothetical protein
LDWEEQGKECCESTNKAVILPRSEKGVIDWGKGQVLLEECYQEALGRKIKDIGRELKIPGKGDRVGTKFG